MQSAKIGYAGSVSSNVTEVAPKVLLVIEASGGGSGRHVIELAEGLLEYGCKVHLIFSQLRADRAFLTSLERLAVIKHHVPMRRQPHPSDFSCMLEIRRYIQECGGFDVVHAHSSKAGALARLASVGLDAARIYTPHAMRTMDLTLHPVGRAFYRFIEVALARSVSDALIAVSESERRHIIEQGVPASKSYVVANGIPAAPAFDRPAIRQDVGLAADDICIGFIGRLVPQKAPERFVSAVACLARRDPRVRGLIVGTGPLEHAVERLARQYGIIDRLIRVTDRPGPAVLPAFDILLMPSLYEGMPYVLLEALSVGVPVVATDVGGVAEAVEQAVTGFVVPQENEGELLEKLGLLVQDTPLRNAFAAASLRKSSEMTVDRMVDETLNVYRAALAARAAGQRRITIGFDPKQVS